MKKKQKPAEEAVKNQFWSGGGGRFWRGADTYERLPAGLFRCGLSTNTGPYLAKQTIAIDNLVELPDEINQSILDEFELFWKRKQHFADRGFIHKRGFFLYGPPGSGKTSTLQLLIKRLVDEQDGIVVFVEEPGPTGQCLQMLRSIELERPIIAIMEDIDTLVQKHGENEYLALLDGEAQVANIVFVATTNYPERLDKRFTDRPSRFDTIACIPMPSANARRVYLKAKEASLTEEELDAWVAKSDDFSIAHLKELIIAVKCLGQPFEEAVSRLRKMIEQAPKANDASRNQSMGFTRKKPKTASISENGHGDEVGDIGWASVSSS